jgi:hypothetical protein
MRHVRSADRFTHYRLRVERVSGLVLMFPGPKGHADLINRISAVSHSLTARFPGQALC